MKRPKIDDKGFSVPLALTDMIPVLFFGLGVLGMVLMVILAIKLDCGNPKANWLEQAVNGAAQACFFIGLLLV